jgi:transposase InsO family protein
MTDADHCAQNALAECMNGILKSEFLLDHRFLSFDQARRVVDDSINTYNHLRVHGSLNGKTPAEVHYGTDNALELWAKELVSYSLPYPSDLCYV